MIIKSAAQCYCANLHMKILFMNGMNMSEQQTAQTFWLCMICGVRWDLNSISGEMSLCKMFTLNQYLNMHGRGIEYSVHQV